MKKTTLQRWIQFFVSYHLYFEGLEKEKGGKEYTTKIMCHRPLLSQEAVFEPAPSPRERENAQKTDTTDTNLDPDVPPR